MKNPKYNKVFSVVGLGYIGLSLAVSLSKKYNVNCIEVDKIKLSQLKAGLCPIIENELQEALLDNHDCLTFCDRLGSQENGVIFICLPTDFDEPSNQFDTSIIEDFLNENRLEIIKNNLIVIRSTIPVGFTRKLQDRFPSTEFLFVPEFLREGSALADSLNPSRVVIGGVNTSTAEFIGSIITSITTNSPEVIYMGSDEAELSKLAANTYLASRVAFFNELDTICMDLGLAAKKVVKAISTDSRIGDYYNNPSFGYGGYCLPKDTKQVASMLDSGLFPLITSISKSNEMRVIAIVNKILENTVQTIGLNWLQMKQGSDNFRSSAIIKVAELLINKGVEVLFFEPLFDQAWNEGGD